MDLINEEKAECLLIIECSASVFRKAYPITTTPTDLNVYIKDLKGAVNVSSYVYAKTNIVGFFSDNFSDEYNGFNFDLDKFCILAADDGYKFIIDTDPSTDNKVSSIFTIVAKEDIGPMTYSDDDRKITIRLSREYFDDYDRIKRKAEYNNIAFAMIAIPVLSSCISELQNKYEDIEELVEQKPWVNAVRLSYKKVTNEELELDTFNSKSSLELSQIVLNDASCKGISDFETLLVNGADGGAEDE